MQAVINIALLRKQAEIVQYSLLPLSVLLSRLVDDELPTEPL